MKNWLLKFLAGMGIGTGAAIPGVSGAAIAVICKVYEQIIWAINNFRKAFKRAIVILLPILLGIFCAVVPCIILFDKALDHFVFGTMCIFAGFLIGSFPGVLDEVKGTKITKKLVICIVIGFIFVILLGIASVFLGREINIESQFAKMDFWMYLVLIPVGVLAAVALTVPGLSGSLILLIIGFYKPLLSFTVEWAKEMFGAGVPQSFANTGKWFGMLGCFALGVLIGVVLVGKIMSKLLEKHRTVTYFVIVGFIIGSLFVLFFNYNIYEYYLAWAGQPSSVDPSLKMYVEIPLGIGLLVVCMILSYLLVYFSRKKSKKEIEQ